MRQVDGELPADAAARPVDLSSFEGAWRSSNRATRGIAAVDLEVSGGALRGRVYGAGPKGEIDWGEVTASAVYTDGVASDTVAGCIFNYDFGATRGRLQANLKLGVMVLGLFRGFDDGSGRHGYFAREFLARPSASRTSMGGGGPIAPGAGGGNSVLCSEDLGLGAVADLGPIDPAIILGRWRNTHARSRGVVEVAVERRREGVLLRLWGAQADGPLDWGATPGDVYVCLEEDDVPSVCALGRYDFGFMESELQVRQNKGILAVTTFNRFRDGSGRRDYVTRELYHRVASR